MAKPIRPVQVYNRNRLTQPRKLPFRQPGFKPFEYEKAFSTPEYFPEHIEERPKLWLAWMYRSTRGEPNWIVKDTKVLFGEECQPGKMRVFKNCHSTNERLWKLKHLIEIKPITFPHGEPTENDVGYIELKPSGECIIDKRLAVEPETLDLDKSMESKQFTSGYLLSKTMQKYHTCQRVQEDDVWSDPNFSQF